MSDVHERFMRLALDEARQGGAKGNMAVGAVIVRGGEVLERGHNEATSAFDVTAHAETAAIRKLSPRLRVANPGSRAGEGPLADCVLYTTVEPCPMCCWATCIAGIGTIVIGATHARLGISRGTYTAERLAEMTGQPLRVVSGVLAEECAAAWRASRRA